MSEGLSSNVGGEKFIAPETGKSVESEDRKEEEKYPFEGGIIVFGHGYSDRSWQLSLEAKMRAIGAYQLYKEGIAPRIILTGGAPSDTDKERYGDGLLSNSEQMARMLVEQFHVPQQDIITESQSTNTIENTAHALTNLEKQGLPTDEFVTVSTGYHMDRITEIMKKFNLVSQPISAEEGLNMRALEHAEKMKQKDIEKGLSPQDVEKNYLMRRGRYSRSVERIKRANEGMQNQIKSESKWLSAMRENPGFWIPQTLAVRGSKLKEIVDMHREDIEAWLARHPDIEIGVDDLLIGNFDFNELVSHGRELPK